MPDIAQGIPAVEALAPAAFDFRNPDYTDVFAERVERLMRLRALPLERRQEVLRGLFAFYRDHPWQLIDDWGCTFDPRLVERGLPAVVPFKLFPRQIEWCQWVVARWKAQEPGLTEKSRDMGVSWLAVALSSALCLTHEGMAIGFGSRKEEYVDKLGAPKSLFWKAREFLKLLPHEFRLGWGPTDAPHMRISFPGNGSVIVGEAGDNIGRGDRAGIYFVDEEAFLERPMLVEASLSQTTNCRISISTPHGMANPFAIKRFSWPEHRIFIFDWRHDPRKDDVWYARQQRDLDAVTLAQEVDRDYSASITGRLISSAWVQSCIDAHVTLGFEPTGTRRGALDVADEGPDLNAFAVGRGVLVENVTAWSGSGDDIFKTVAKAFGFCDVLGIAEFDYDADGMGAGVRGDARVLNEKRAHKIEVTPWRGSGEVVDKLKPIETAAPRNEKKLPGEIVRLNEDYYRNAKAQGWFSLRARIQRTHRAVEMHKAGEDWREAYHPDDLVSFSSKMPDLHVVVQQLTQPTYTSDEGSGKMKIDKAPKRPGEPPTKSPNHGDAVMIYFAPRKRRGRYRLDAFAT